MFAPDWRQPFLIQLGVLYCKNAQNVNLLYPFQGEACSCVLFFLIRGCVCPGRSSAVALLYDTCMVEPTVNNTQLWCGLWKVQTGICPPVLLTRCDSYQEYSPAATVDHWVLRCTEPLSNLSAESIVSAMLISQSLSFGMLKRPYLFTSQPISSWP